MGQKSDELRRDGYIENVATVDELDGDTDPYLSRSTLADSSSVATAELVGDRSLTPAAGDLEDEYSSEPQDEDIEATRAQIEQTRAEMSVTIDAIQEKLSPANLAQEAKDVVRDATIGKAQTMVSGVQDKAQELVGNAGDSAAGLGSGIVDTIRRNPIPAALTGIGLGWLYVSSRKSGSSSKSYRGYEPAYYPGYAPGNAPEGYPGYRGNTPDGPGYYRPYDAGNAGDNGRGSGITGSLNAAAGQVSSTTGQLAGQVQDTAGQVAGQISGTAGQVAGQISDTAGQLAGQISNTAGNVAGQVQASAGQVAQQAQYGARQARGGFQQLLSENPLVVGAGAVLAGLALGLAIPETPKENELLGPTHDQLMDQAQQLVTEKAQQVQAVAQQTVGAAKDAAKSAAQDAAKEQGLTSTNGS